MKSPLLVDLAVAVALVAALGITSIVDRLVPAPERDSQRAGRSLLQPDSVYALRTEKNRGDWIVQFGGTEKSEKAAAAGLAWLARHQHDDGSWANRHLGRGNDSVCDREPRCQGPGSEFPMAQTGLPLLAFQAGGHFYFNENTYSDNVRRGLDWLAENQKPDGGLYSSTGNSYMYEHGIATFALAEACAVAVASNQTPDNRYLSATKLAIAYIESQQHNDGGWRYTGHLGNPSDTSVSGWQVLALKSALAAEMPVNDECLEKIKTFFKSCEMDADGRTSYTAGGQMITEATTGVGMLVHQFLLDTPESGLVRQAAPYLAQLMEDTWGNNRNHQADYYLWYNCTLAMFGAGGNPWERWNAVGRDLIIDLQEGPEAGCAHGSWPPANSVHGQSGGRIYTTALAVLTLEVYYRFAKKQKE